MSKGPDMLEYTFTVDRVSVSSGMPDESASVTAAYFQESGAYTLFKDGVHLVVAAFKTDLVTRIARVESPVVDRA